MNDDLTVRSLVLAKRFCEDNIQRDVAKHIKAFHESTGMSIDYVAIDLTSRPVFLPTDDPGPRRLEAVRVGVTI